MLWLWALPAFAWPVDVVMTLPLGTERLHPFSVLEWVVVEDPSIVTVEALPARSELVLVAKAVGRTRLLLYAEGQFAVWRLEVPSAGANPSVPEFQAELGKAKQSCPGLKHDKKALNVHIRDERCRAALLPLLRTDAFLARDLQLLFEVPALQSQLQAFSPVLEAEKLKARYLGAGLILEGRASKAAHQKALWALFDASVGRVALEDRVVLVEGSGESR